MTDPYHHHTHVSQFTPFLALPSFPSLFQLGLPWVTGSPAKPQLLRPVWIPALEVMDYSIVLPDNYLSLNPC